jgi:hypothetical protein
LFPTLLKWRQQLQRAPDMQLNARVKALAKGRRPAARAADARCPARRWRTKCARWFLPKGALAQRALCIAGGLMSSLVSSLTRLDPSPWLGSQGSAFRQALARQARAQRQVNFACVLRVGAVSSWSTRHAVPGNLELRVPSGCTPAAAADQPYRRCTQRPHLTPHMYTPTTLNSTTQRSTYPL